MNDEETVALIAGGHIVRQDPRRRRPRPRRPGARGLPGRAPGPRLEERSTAPARARDAITSGLEVTWTQTPTQWSNKFFENLFGFEWELTKSPAGAHQWQPKDGAGANTVPDPRGRLAEAAPPTMLTTDLALRFDPEYEKISRRFLEHPDEFALAFAKAWYKLLHRDMGPVERYLGPWVPEPQLWQDPVPPVEGELVSDADVAALKEAVLGHRAHRAAAGRARPGRRRPASAAPTSAAGPTAPASGWSRSAAGSPTTPTSSTPCSTRSSGSRPTSTAAAGPRSRSPTSSCWPAPRRSRRRRATPATTSPCRSTPGRTDATQEQTDVDSFRGAASRAPTGSAATCPRARSCRPRRCCSTAPTCSTSPRRR